VLVGVGLLVVRCVVLGWVDVRFFREPFAFVDVNLGGGDSAAVDLFYLEAGVQVQGGGGLVEDGGIDTGIDEGSEEHVTTDAGEAVEIGDTHGRIVSWAAGASGSVVRVPDGKRFSWDERCRWV
jgi:hypothetical protein